jgi:hypothetical protein
VHRDRQRQHAGRPAKAHRRAFVHSPAVGSDFDGTPMLVGEIKINVVLMFSDADVDGALGSVELRPRLEQIEL